MKKKVGAIVLLCICILLCLELYRSNRMLSLDHETVSTDLVTETVRIVHLSDLHNAKFGENNEDLLALIAYQQPDLILFTGDLVTGYIRKTDVAMNLVEELTKIAPVYVSIGNHERMHEGNFGSDLTGSFQYRGAKVLEFSYEDVTVKGQNLRIGGISGYCVPETYLWTGEAKVPESEYLKEFQNTDRCTLLMAHIPVSWILNDAISYWDPDFVFSGHVHGGQIRLPLIGGVYAPDMGLFPGWVEGLYPSRDGTNHLVVSRGLGNSMGVPRLNNPPQVLVLDILPQK